MAAEISAFGRDTGGGVSSAVLRNERPSNNIPLPKAIFKILNPAEGGIYFALFSGQEFEVKPSGSK